jgi:hypothetical protein
LLSETATRLKQLHTVKQKFITRRYIEWVYAIRSSGFFCIAENVALGLTYALAAASAGITYQTSNFWMNKGKNSKSGEYFEFYKHIKKCNANGALKCLQRLKEAADAGESIYLNS